MQLLFFYYIFLPEFFPECVFFYFLTFTLQSSSAFLFSSLKTCSDFLLIVLFLRICTTGVCTKKYELLIEFLELITSLKLFNLLTFPASSHGPTAVYIFASHGYHTPGIKIRGGVITNMILVEGRV